MIKVLRSLAYRLPDTWQHSLKRRHFARQIHREAFGSEEPEFTRLTEWLKPGDWALDIGANVGHYTLSMSRIVGHSGRVIALEPIPQTFELLAANCNLSTCRNVTPLNLAATSTNGVVGMTVPVQGGGRNYYEAAIRNGATGDGYTALGLTIDSLPLPHRIALVKIDAEDHELSVIEGMAKLLERDSPTLIVEGRFANAFLESLGYRGERTGNSPNFVWRRD